MARMAAAGPRSAPARRAASRGQGRRAALGGEGGTRGGAPSPSSSSPPPPPPFTFGKAGERVAAELAAAEPVQYALATGDLAPALARLAGDAAEAERAADLAEALLAQFEAAWAAAATAAASAAAEEGEDAAANADAAFRGAAAAVIPHPAKVAKGGEDAHFLAPRRGMLGVADGVGGWNDSGVDPALYARELMRQAAGLARRREAGGEAMFTDPQVILEGAHLLTEVPGSATACVLALEGGGSGRLRASNLGDSSFRVVRAGAVVYACPTLEHYFNCPYQLAWQEFVRSDLPADALEVSCAVEAGDVIIVGSDGLFDNLFDEEIGAIVADVPERGPGGGGDGEGEEVAADAICRALANAAYERSQDREYVSPFAVARAADESKRGGLAVLGAKLKPQPGGKPDDITCVVAVV